MSNTNLKQFGCVVGGALLLSFAMRNVPGFGPAEWVALWVCLCFAGAYWHYVHEGNEHGK